MGFVSLYRKYRPIKFSDLVGQDQIVKTLKNSIKYDRIAHAYLFAGPRGTGKTSTAKVYARALNCKDDSNIEPCGVCENCRRIESGQSMDVIEIDAASNRGIDEIRELREQVKYQPGEGNYRIYIIDEVHMLTDQAFNALLKTLEEPPEKVVFILATTEPHKVISTVLSRCQRFDFTLLTEAEIAERLAFICQEEEVEFADEALRIIAYSSNGGMRDAISILDQAISYCEGSLKPEQIEDMLGKIDTSALSQYVNNIADNDAASALELTQELKQHGRSVDRIVADLLDYVRQILLTVRGGYNLAAAGLSEVRKKQLKKDSKLFNKAKASEVLTQLIDLNSQLRYSDRPDILLESTIINLADDSTSPLENAGDGSDQISQLAEKVARLEEKLSSKNSVTETVASKEIEKAEMTEPINSHKDAPQTVSQTKQKTSSQKESPSQTSRQSGEREVAWQEIMSKIQENDITTHAKLKECLPPKLEKGKLIIEFPANKSFHYRQAKAEKDFIERIVKEVMDENITPVIRLKGDQQKKEVGEVEQNETEYEGDFEASSKQDVIKELQQRLGGQIVKVSAEALKKSEGGKNDGYEKNDAEGTENAEKDAEETGGA